MMKTKQSVLMFPWLGHGHLSPFLELAKNLTSTNLFEIYLCSTPANLDSVRKTISPSIELIDLHLPSLPGLEPHLHTTNGLPAHLMPILIQAFDMASPRFSEILEDLKPDLLIYDMIQPGAATAAAAQGIPSVVFITTSVSAIMVHLYLNATKRITFPFSNIYYRDYEIVKILDSVKKCGEEEKDRLVECVASSSGIVLVKSCKEIEGKYADYLSVLSGKKTVLVGSLVANPLDMKQNSVIQWLDTKATGSTVLVSFGTEYFLSSNDLKEIAYGLELSNVNFIWVLRFPKDERKINISEELPLGFLKRVNNRGLLVEGWVPQTKILAHKNIGGFVSHCGWNSVLEAMKFGVPIIAMPMHLDQPINARLVVEVGVGVEVVRESNGRLRREEVAKVVNRVVVSKLGEVVREKAEKLGDDLKLKGDEEIDVVADELLRVCNGGGGRGSDGSVKFHDESFAIDGSKTRLSRIIQINSEILNGKEKEEDEIAMEWFYEELKSRRINC